MKVLPLLAMGVCKQWNGLLEWWNTGMVEWKVLKVYYEFLHLNIPQLAYFHILSILHFIIDQNLIQFMLAQEYWNTLDSA